MFFTAFADGILSVTCMKSEPTLAVVTVDGESLTMNFPTGVGTVKAKVLWEPKVIKAVGIPYVPIEKKLPPGEHHKKPKEYSNVPDSEFAGPGKTFPVNSAKRVHSALAYFTKHPWQSASEKKTAARKILAAAKKHGIAVDKKDNVYRAAHGK
jgi:Family of unknown function (DUF6582)